MALAVKDERIAFRATKEQKALIERGASVRGQKVTEFVISSAQEKAEMILADQKEFVLSTDRWNAFVSVLDRPVNRHERLARLMSEPSVLER